MIDVSEKYLALAEKALHSGGVFAEYQCAQIPGASRSPEITIGQDQIKGIPIITRGFCDVDAMIIGNIYVGTLDPITLRKSPTSQATIEIYQDNLGMSPYAEGDCFDFQHRFVNYEDQEDASEWVTIGRYIISEFSWDYQSSSWRIKGEDACSILDKFEVTQAIGDIPAIENDHFNRLYGFNDCWNRIVDMVHEYCRLNGLWEVNLDPLPILGSSQISNLGGYTAREVATYFFLAGGSNVRATNTGDIITRDLRELSQGEQTQSVYARDASLRLYESEYPIEVIRLSGDDPEKTVIFPIGSNLPNDADRISLFDYYSPFFNQGQPSAVYNNIHGYENLPFYADYCHAIPNIEPGDKIGFQDNHEEPNILAGGLLAMYVEMRCEVLPSFRISCGHISKATTRGLTSNQVSRISTFGGGSGGGGGGSNNPSLFAFVDITNTVFEIIPTLERVYNVPSPDIYCLFGERGVAQASGRLFVKSSEVYSSGTDNVLGTYPAALAPFGSMVGSITGDGCSAGLYVKENKNLHLVVHQGSIKPTGVYSLEMGYMLDNPNTAIGSLVFSVPILLYTFSSSSAEATVEIVNKGTSAIIIDSITWGLPDILSFQLVGNAKIAANETRTVKGSLHGQSIAEGVIENQMRVVFHTESNPATQTAFLAFVFIIDLVNARTITERGTPRGSGLVVWTVSIADTVIPQTVILAPVERGAPRGSGLVVWTVSIADTVIPQTVILAPVERGAPRGSGLVVWTVSISD